MVALYNYNKRGRYNPVFVDIVHAVDCIYLLDAQKRKQIERFL